MIEKLYDINNLYDSFLKIRKASGWKERTQRYEENLMINLYNLRNDLITGQYRPSKPHIFTLRERGKKRLIESYNIEDRIVQRCLVYHVLLPIVRPKLIYDNDASLEDRGTSHFRKRLSFKLHRYAEQHGNNGYILLGDFSKFFDNIRHDVFLQCLKEMGVDDEVLAFTNMILDAHMTDVSYMNDEEFSNCMDRVFNALEYNTIPRTLLTGEKMMPKSVGIGSHLAQLAGIVMPYKLDNYIKIVKGCNDYARYNDDFYVIHESKEYLKDLLKDIEQICSELGIFLNRKKTQIVPLRHRFTILQTQYWITDNKRVVEIPAKCAYKRERDKLRGLKRRYDKGEISFAKVQIMYKSWRNTIAARKGTFRSVTGMDAYFQKQFGKPYDYEIKKVKRNKNKIFAWEDRKDV